MKGHGRDAADMMCVLCDNLLKEKKQAAPLQFMELLFSYKTQPHLGEWRGGGVSLSQSQPA